MVRIAQMYYRMQLSQEQIGERLGLSRFQVGASSTAHSARTSSGSRSCTR
jgi:DNA-binding transcriptional regulator LsrR (DeoR family)